MCKKAYTSKTNTVNRILYKFEYNCVYIGTPVRSVGQQLVRLVAFYAGDPGSTVRCDCKQVTLVA